MSRKRSPKFSESELQTLLTEVEMHKALLFSKLSNSDKKMAWDTIYSRINAVNTSTHKRTVEEIRKKWTTYMSNTKKKFPRGKKDRRGPHPEEISSLEDKVLGIIGEAFYRCVH